jgi:hypothetical protein
VVSRSGTSVPIVSRAQFGQKRGAKSKKVFRPEFLKLFPGNHLTPPTSRKKARFLFLVVFCFFRPCARPPFSPGHQPWTWETSRITAAPMACWPPGTRIACVLWCPGPGCQVGQSPDLATTQPIQSGGVNPFQSPALPGSPQLAAETIPLRYRPQPLAPCLIIRRTHAGSTTKNFFIRVLPRSSLPLEADRSLCYNSRCWWSSEKPRKSLGKPRLFSFQHLPSRGSNPRQTL